MSSKMSTYVWSGCWCDLFRQHAQCVDIYSTSFFMEAASISESIMMIPGTYAEMHKDYD